MKQENMDIYESQIVKEETNISETISISENENILENISNPHDENIEEVSVNQTGSQVKPNHLMGISSSIVAVIGVLIVAATNLVNYNFMAEFSSFAYLDGRIIYELNYEEMASDNNLVIDFYEDNVIKTSYELASSLDVMINEYDLRNLYSLKNGIENKIEKENLVTHVQNMNNDEEIIFSVYENDVYNRKFTVSDKGKKVKIEGSISLDTSKVEEKLENAPDETIRFKATLKGNVGLLDRTFDNYAIKVVKQVSQFSDVSYRCDCNIDGYFKFTMNYNDQYGVFTNFKAYLTDLYGNKKECVLNEDLHSQQQIYVLDDTLKGEAMTLYIEFENNGNKEIHEINVTI